MDGACSTSAVVSPGSFFLGGISLLNLVVGAFALKFLLLANESMLHVALHFLVHVTGTIYDGVIHQIRA